MTTITGITCQKCGRQADEQDGWLVAPRANDPERLVVRCPEHVSQWSRRQAGLPQQNRQAKVKNTLATGKRLQFCQHYAELSIGQAEYRLMCYDGCCADHWYATVPELVAAMRQVQPDLRKWRIVK